MAGIYPVGVEVAPGGPVARWRPLVNWLLVLPPLVLLVVVSCGASVAAVVAWVAIVTTGRMPDRLGEYLVAVLRYAWRVWSFLFGLTDQYPGFRLVAGYVDPGDHASLFYSAQPVSRRRTSVLFRFVLILPVLLVSCVVGLGLVVLLLVGWFAVLFLGSWPAQLRTAIVAWFQWLLRVTAYGWLIVDDYPPIPLDTSRLALNDAQGVTTPPSPDPREAFGPPWPRLVGGQTYAAPPLLRWPTVVGLLFWAGPLVIAVTSTGSAPASRSLPPAAPTRSVQSTATFPPTNPTVGRELSTRLIPAPAAYSAGPGLMSSNGVITPAGFDKAAGAGSAADVGFLGGSEAAYNSNTSSDFLDIQLLEFSSPGDAVLFQQAPASEVVPDEAATQSEFPAIPGATAVDGTKASSGFYDHVVMATKGPVLMIFDYTTSSGGPAPTDVVAWAEQQYKRL